MKEIMSNSVRHQQITTQIVQMTPAMAKSLLEKNTNNRPCREHHVDKLAGAIKRGEWMLNGDSIRVSVSGVLLDGQHRLEAILKSGVSVSVLMITGLDDAAFSTIDRGLLRRVSDALSISKLKHTTTLAALINLVFKHEKSGNPFIGSHDLPTAQQALLMIESDPLLEIAASKAASSDWLKKYMTAPMAAFCFREFYKSHPEKCREFFSVLQLGAGLESTSPVFLLREFLISSRDNKKITVNQHYKCAMTFKAFKAYCSGQSLKFLR